MKDYDRLIEEIKEKLKNADGKSAELEKLYSEARKNAEEKYRSLRAETLEKRIEREAVSNNSFIEKNNISQVLEDKGLNRSGEAAAAKNSERRTHEKKEYAINQNEKSELNELEQKKSDEIIKLKQNESKDIEQNKKAIISDLTKQLNSLESEKKKAEAEEEKKRIDAEKKKITAEKAAAEAEKKRQEEFKKAEEEKANAGYKPPLGAKEYAKALVKRFAGEKSELDAASSKKLRDYLKTAFADEPLNNSYFKDLLFALELYGYDADANPENEAEETKKPENISPPEIKPDISSEKQQKDIIKASSDSYKDAYQKFRKLWQSKGMSVMEVEKQAAENASDIQLDYLYMRSPNISEFERLAFACGYGRKRLEDYYERVEYFDKSNLPHGKIELGSLV